MKHNANTTKISHVKPSSPTKAKTSTEVAAATAATLSSMGAFTSRRPGPVVLEGKLPGSPCKNSKLNCTLYTCPPKKKGGSQKLEETQFETLFSVTIEANEFRRLFQDGSRLLLPMHQISPRPLGGWARPLVCRTSRAFGHLKVAWVAHSLYIGHILSDCTRTRQDKLLLLNSVCI